MTNLRTGETTSKGFIKVMEERGVEVNPSMTAESLRDAFNEIGTVSFESDNERILTVVNSANETPAEEPAAEPEEEPTSEPEETEEEPEETEEEPEETEEEPEEETEEETGE